MKRILFIITGLSSGGAERQLTGLAKLLHDNGYVVQVCWYTDNNFFSSFLIDNGIDYKCLYTSSHFKKIINIRCAIRDFFPDVVISFLDGPNTICSYLKAVTFGKYKLIVSERSFTRKIGWRERLRFLGYRYADYIVPNSYSQSQFIKEHYPSYRNKVITITNFTDLIAFHPTNIEQRTPLRGIVAARLNEGKNVKRFIKAVYLAKEKGAEFVINWYGSAKDKKYYLDCIYLLKKYGIEDYFRIHPATNNIVEKYLQSDFAVLPSHYEGFPNFICESMSCGLPILCSNVCDNGFLVQNSVNGYLFNQLSEYEMANCIYEFWRLPLNRRKEMGKESRIIAERLLSSHVFINKYINIIEK